MLPLVCIDVDGTLVGPSGQPTDAVWAAAERATAAGQRLALTTARGAFGPTFEWARRLDPDGWHIFHAGAALVPATPERDSIVQPLTPSTVDAITRAARPHGWTVEYYAVADYRVSDAGDLARSHAELMGVPEAVGGPEDLEGPVVRVQLVIPHAAVAQATEAMAPLASVSTATSPVQQGATFMSLTAEGVSKIAGIAELASRLGVGLDRVMMVGDSHNDLEAVAGVGHGVAMGNAEPEVAAAARHRVADVTDDGLVEALELSADL